MAENRGLEIGTVLWRMVCPSDKYPDGWYAEPKCVEYLDEHKFLFGDKTGASRNCIGSTYFMTREEALEHHRNAPRAMTSAPRKTEKRPELYDHVSKNTIVIMDETRIFDMLLDRQIQPETFDWNEDEYTGERWLRLNDIRKQLALKGITCFTVASIGPLRGAIYMYGNYNDDKFRLFGETMGYA